MFWLWILLFGMGGFLAMYEADQPKPNLTKIFFNGIVVGLSASWILLHLFLRAKGLK